MNGAVHLSLAWRQCRERAAQVALIVGVAVALQLAMMIEFDAEMLSTLLIMQTLAIAGPATLLMSMQGAAGAREAGTLKLLRGLPVRRVTVAGYEILGTAAACVAAVLVTAGVAYVLFRLRAATASGVVEQARWLKPAQVRESVRTCAACAGAGSLAALHICLWTFCVGSRRSTRSHAGAAVLGVLMVWVVLLSVAAMVITAVTDRGYGIEWLLAVSPFGGLLAINEVYAGWVVCQVLVLVPLAVWALRVWGTEVEKGGSTRAAAAQRRALKAGFHSFRGAMAWKLWHDVGATMVVGVGFVLVVSVLMGLSDQMGESRMVWMARSYVSLMGGIGYALAALVAVSAYAGDLRADALAFWRSRPIGAGAWFWPRLATGAALLLVGVHGIAAALFLLSPYGLDELRRSPIFFVTLPLHLLTFGMTVWMVCVLRHAIYGAILGLLMALCVAAVGMIAPRSPLLNVDRAGDALTPTIAVVNGQPVTVQASVLSWDYMQLFVPAVVIAGVAVYLAWRSVRSPAALEPTALPWAAE